MKGKMNPPLEVGDKIVCYHMEGESAVPPGTEGIVTKISRDPFEVKDENIINVKWDNGSSLALITSTDAWKLVERKNIEEQRDVRGWSFFEKNPDLFEYFDWRWFRDYLKLVQDSGIVNMLEAAPFVYSGREHIDRYHGEGREDDESFQKLLDSADEAKDKFIVNLLDYMQAKDLDVDDIDRVNTYARMFSKALLGAYMTFYR